ncbi:Asparagine synthetase [Myxococcus hansupus]|uniref:asparagine synthase (glutamine-hydrolyzing) n=1 Tax=Pseudomyxococcus hansupus TaxID=1297742 RepID=A0A0H4XN32_9BACT|nr:asparagine synthase C-terminal domain-containing protein [Myxococcus hansupus]AKQ69782.1 Asparagine synthetase [Myxococcus hansupus]
MPHASGGLLATLPRYQSSARLESSVWRLAPSGLEPEAVAAFLHHALAPEASVFRGVRRVPGPLPHVRRAAEADSEDRLAELLLAALEQGVRQQVTAGTVDVSLSGGVDSAALCAMAARQAPGRVLAWTMNVHFADVTERRNARAVADATGVELVDIVIPDAVLPELFERAVLSQETAILNARAVASFAFYAEARRQGASTLLSGAGADEVLMGNPDALAGAAARVAEDRRLARAVLRPGLVDNLGVDQQARALPWGTGAGPGEEDHPEEVRYAAWVLRELVLPPELRSAAAQGLSVRTPYLDTGFAEVALGLPAAVLARNGAGKWLFRHAVRSLVPDAVRLARKTPRYAHTALSSPVRERWLALYREWLTPTRLAPLEAVDPVATRRLLERYASLAPDAHEAGAMDRLLMRLCSLAMLHAHALARPPCPES